MGAKLVKGFCIALGVVLLIVMLLIFARDTSRIINWSSSGFVLSSIMVADSTVMFWQAVPEDFITSSVPVRGDTLVTINGSAASLDLWIEVLELPHTPGKEATIGYIHDGILHHATMKTRPVQGTHFYSVVVLQILRILIFLSFIALGFWAFFRRPDSPGIRALTFYSFSVSGFVGITYLPMFVQVASFQIPFENTIRGSLIILTVFFSSFWLLLNLLFPHRSRILEKHPWLAYALCFLPQVILIILTFTSLAGVAWFGFTVYGVIVAQTFAGLLLLRYHHIHTSINLEKRQTKLVFWGSGGSLILLLVYILDMYNIIPYFRTLALLPRLLVTNVIFLFLLASPISFAYAFGRYRLLEVEGRLRKGTRHLIMTIVLLVAFFGLAYLIGVILLESIGVTGRTPTLLVALFLALGFAPAQRNIRNQLENRFYPERKKLRRLTMEFMQTASALADCESFCGQLEERFRETLSLKTVRLALKEKNNESFILSGVEKVPIEEGGDLITYLRNNEHPLLLDEAVASSRVRFTDTERRWLSDHDVALILPLKTHGQVQGFLALGHKVDREDFNPEELQILATLSDQIALALENFTLLEENLVKRRMEEELQVARRVQLGFLPLEIPQTQGLEVSSSSTFSLEVAGDYYDVIPLEDGSTLLAVGDVSGKGAGAALIMANLQASLRALCGVELRLADLVARINNIICHNTEPEQYITFFVGVFDPAKKTFTYVNAGHNPPLLVRDGNKIESLDVGGLIVGAFPALDYEQETLQLSTGDLLLVYTDGISEAMNQAGEEFGEERVRNTLLTHVQAATQQIKDRLIHEVERFRVEGPPDDDMTLQVVRVL